MDGPKRPHRMGGFARGWMRRGPTVGRHPISGPGVLAGLIALVGLDCYATSRIAATSSEFDIAMTIGLASGFAWVTAFAEVLRRLLRKQPGPIRAVLGWTVIIAILAWTGCFAVTLPRFGPSHARTSLGMFTLSFAASAGVGLCVLLAVRMKQRAGATEPRHTAISTAEVWHVRGRDLDYFIAHCDCDWVGPSHDANEPEALDRAESDARNHATHVAPDVVYMDV